MLAFCLPAIDIAGQSLQQLGSKCRAEPAKFWGMGSCARPCGRSRMPRSPIGNGPG